MTDIAINAVHVLNRYVYDLLLVNGGVKTRSAYGGRTPIIPSQQQPEFMEYNDPWLVYGFSENTPSDLDMLHSATVAYAIYAAGTYADRDVVKIINIMREAFRRWDDSARDINNYKYANTSFRDITFTSMSTGLIEGPSPSGTEGGRTSGIVSIRYEYIPNYGITTVPPMT